MSMRYYLFLMIEVELWRCGEGLDLSACKWKEGIFELVKKKVIKKKKGKFDIKAAILKEIKRQYSKNEISIEEYVALKKELEKKW